MKIHYLKVLKGFYSFKSLMLLPHVKNIFLRYKILEGMNYTTSRFWSWIPSHGIMLWRKMYFIGLIIIVDFKVMFILWTNYYSQKLFFWCWQGSHAPNPKDLDKGYNFVWDLTSIRGLNTKLWASKVTRVSILRISKL